MRGRLVVLVTGALCALGCAGLDQVGLATPPPPPVVPEVAPPPSAVRPSNVLILLADDLGADRIGAYGVHPEPASTPNIDALAAEGVRFRNAYVAPVCSPTRASLLTGRHPRRIGMGTIVSPKKDPSGLARSEVTLPEMLVHAPQPWASLALGKWHLAVDDWPDRDRDPLVQGFDHYAGALENLPTIVGEQRKKKGNYYDWQKTVDGETTWSTRYATTDTVDEALARIPNLEEPWLVYVAFQAVHHPFDLPPPELTPTLRSGAESVPRTVDAMAEALDTELGRLLAGVDRSDTTVVFLSDNGTTKEAIKRPWPPERGKLTLYDGGCRVPLIITGPAVTRPGSTSDAFVHAMDLFPTVAELAGVDLSSVTAADGSPVVLDGVSLLPWLADPDAPSPRETIYVDRFGPNGAPPYLAKDERMIRDAGHKLMRTKDGEAFFEYPADGGWQEGPNLLPRGLTPAQQAAYDRLAVAMASRVQQLEGVR
ncbi:MAG: arylsulfatase B [Myxococcota bacterium]